MFLKIGTFCDIILSRTALGEFDAKNGKLPEII